MIEILNPEGLGAGLDRMMRFVSYNLEFPRKEREDPIGSE